MIPTGNVSYTTTWIGNTYGNSDGRHVQDFVNAIAVAPNGTIFTNTYWDESGYESVAYSTDGSSMKPLGNTHGFGGISIALNSSYVYVGQSLGVSSTDYQYGLTRRTIGDPTQGAPFSTGSTLGTLGQAFLVVNNNVTSAPTAANSAQIAGLAANGSYLYVSNPYASQILIYDASSMAQLATISVPNSQQIALDPNGGLWAVQRATGSLTGNVLHYSAYVPGHAPSLLGSWMLAYAPAGIAVDASDRLFLSDDTVYQMMGVFDATTSPPTLQSLIGVPGGALGSETGEPRGFVAPNKLVWPSALGVDASDNIYVASSASGTDLRKLTLSGTMEWMLKASLFLDVPVADPSTDGAVFYGHDSGYNFNYAGSGGSEWSYRSFTIDRLEYPQDPRYVYGSSGHRSTVAVQVLSNQNKYMMVSDQQSGTAAIYRFNGEVAAPSVFFGNFGQVPLPNLPTGASSYIWTDSSGDGLSEANEFADVSTSSSLEWGRDFDPNGGVWRTNVASTSTDPSIIYYPLLGFDSASNPIYTTAPPEQWPAPAPFTEVDRIKYIPATDTLYVTGCTAAAPFGPLVPTFGLAGTTMARYDGWLGGNRSNPTWLIALPYDPADSRAVKAVDVAGSRVFAGMFTSNSAEDVYVYDATDGNYLGQLTPGPQIGSQMGDIDMDYGLHAYQRQSTGEYVVTVEDVVFGKAIAYRGSMNPIPPPSALPNITSNGLVLSLDPALASQGTAPFYSGSSGSCTPAQLNWADVATLDLSSLPFDGVLTNFGACNGQLGWVGSGTPAAPYSLAMDASTAVVTTAQDLNITGDAAFTLSAWVVLNPDAGWNAQNPTTIFNTGILGFGGVPTEGQGVGLLYGYRAGTGILSVEYGNLEGYYSGSQAVPAGKWINLVYTKSPGPIATTSALYLDGALINGAAASPQTPAGATPNLTATPFYIGQWGPDWLLGNAILSVGDVQVYNRALSPGEVESNCAALAARYGVSCGG
ncbi:MAG TPA: LamG-like jellyroll fold domain-containing protein [Polyangia bacterium]|nr:LamG-like jellyroll fold domain-containing protein [Polyangia bacterium]